MTRQETQMLLEFFSRSFPTYKIEDKKGTVELWATFFVDYDFGIMRKVAQAYVLGHKFFPSIAEIKTMADKLNVAVPITPLIETATRPKPLSIEETGCLFCQYYEPGQRDFCVNCAYEGKGIETR